ncbi:hypothetical protein CO116_03770 [Candidatus Falkowbacteria bacterium CG_4_9_14_3_um_filter_38_19]|uniref:POTRA domain-containing protein n=2 Tax=Candidatus Falkowiibacteriota TaxID=1752728 RepID=A0A2M6WPD1_9BACT|nr:hypothetical protein [Candidatus Falkowbacteria bacterium]PIT94657.1 MAG: hypothetical protein COT96_03025 [Candidatus Falkowbacteria bacterium CG10_big_fil_rev_8_21_14_0_10_38_22]PJB15422.1 MAG: hypothetical protein CO116_03770 [Candidatus Falkowbacteria bacterium CG_4_9_14_3_um_filter_38_19]
MLGGYSSSKNKRLSSGSVRLHQAGRKLIFTKKTYANPYFQKQKPRITKAPIYSFGFKLIIFIIFATIIGLSWFLFFSATFNIKEISVIGALKISNTEIEDLCWQQTQATFGRQKNIFLFNKNGLADLINEKYNFDNLKIKKKLPNKIVISFTEKQQAIIWREAEKYYYADNLGNIISEVNPLNISQKNYPLIDNNLEPKIVDKKINITPEKINYILNLFAEFKDKKHGFDVDRFILDNEETTIKMAVINGPTIYFNIKDDLAKQVDKLTVMIEQKLKTDFNQKTYLELRYGDRVYYR